MKKRRQMRTSHFPLKGGLDLVTPGINVKPGKLVASENFEIGTYDGYRRIDGFERFEGTDAPSDASYWLLSFDTGSVEIEAGDTVTGGTSGATGIAVIDGVWQGGSPYANGAAEGYLVLYDLDGTFSNGEDLEVSAVKRAEAVGTTSSRSAAREVVKTNAAACSRATLGLGTEEITDAGDRQPDGSVGNWTLVTDGSSTLTYSTDPVGFDEDKSLLLTAAGDETYMAVKLTLANVDTLTAYVSYRFSAQVYLESGTCTVTMDSQGFDKQGERSTVISSGSVVTVNSMGFESYDLDSANYLILLAFTSTPGAKLYIRNMSLFPGTYNWIPYFPNVVSNPSNAIRLTVGAASSGSGWLETSHGVAFTLISTDPFSNPFDLVSAPQDGVTYRLTMQMDLTSTLGGSVVIESITAGSVYSPASPKVLFTQALTTYSTPYTFDFTVDTDYDYRVRFTGLVEGDVVDVWTMSLKPLKDTDSLDTSYYRSAIEATRTAISKVPGSGNMRGVWTYGGAAYAFRDNAGGTAVDMYKSTSSGWAKQTLGYTLDFDAGSTAFTLDATLTGGSSSAYGTIKKIVIESGAWADNDAAGYVVLYSATDTPFTNNEAITDGSGGAAVADGTGSANAFSNGGVFEFVNYNFTGHAGSRKMYGVNGLDKAFEWDGSTFTWLPTGMTSDAPTHIAAHVNYLWLSFAEGSLQHSGIGDPTAWTLFLGAAEIGIGDTITGLIVTPGMVLAVLSRNSTHILQGSSPQDFFLREYSTVSGAIARTVQSVQEPMYLDDRGLTRLSRVQDFGDYKDNIVSKLVQPRIDAKKDIVVTSVAVKSKNQYILFFSDDTALGCTFKDRRISGFFDLDFGMVVRCIVSGEDSSGNEVVYFGSDDGYIYQLNKGTSFDGSAIDATLRLAYNHCGSPQYWKRFFQVSLEMDATTDPDMTLNFAPDFSYSDPNIPTSTTVDYVISGGDGFWWSELWWNQTMRTLEAQIDGAGVNMGLVVSSSETYTSPFTIHGVVEHYALRAMKR